MSGIYEQLIARLLKSSLLLIPIVVLGFLLRWANRSAYLVYPDSYQNLLVAHHLREGYGVVGPLGDNGMLYPDIFGWTRPLYSLLINVFSSFGMSDITAAFAINLIAGVGAILAAYFLAKKVIGGYTAGLAAALLIAISGNLNIWGGYVLTEAVGVLCLLVFLLALFSSYKKPTYLGDPRFLLIGALLGVSVLARYEYIVLLLPTVLLIVRAQPHFWPAVITTLSGLLFILSLFIGLIGGMPFSGAALWYQLSAQILAFLTLATIGIGIIIAQRKGWLRLLAAKLKGMHWVARKLKVAAISGIILTGIAILIVDSELAGFRFFLKDFLIVLLFVPGFHWLLKVKAHREIVIYLFISLILLGAAYTEINEHMYRYWTHLIPFAVIPAAYGASKLLHSPKFARRSTIIMLILLTVAQGTTSFYGLKTYKDGVYVQTSYEEQLARQVDATVPRDALIIAAMPEPFYQFTGRGVRSVSSSQPYIDLSGVQGDQEIAVINDVGMRAYFPELYEKLVELPDGYREESIIVHKSFLMKNQVIIPHDPAHVYVMRSSALSEFLK